MIKKFEQWRTYTHTRMTDVMFMVTNDPDEASTLKVIWMNKQGGFFKEDTVRKPVDDELLNWVEVAND